MFEVFGVWFSKDSPLTDVCRALDGRIMTFVEGDLIGDPDHAPHKYGTN